MQLFKTATLKWHLLCVLGQVIRKDGQRKSKDRLQRNHEAMPVKKKKKKVITPLPVVQSLPQQTALTSTFRASLTTNRCG